MKVQKLPPSGVERTYGDEEILVSKTDARGIITYANDVFLRVSGYSEQEILGQPHNIIRHHEMPQSVFRLLWNTIKNGGELFAYIVNQSKNGDHYWVHAHVTPTFDAAGKITGYHSNRRSPNRDAIRRIESIYAALLAEERAHGGGEPGIEAALKLLESQLATLGVGYEQFIFSLEPELEEVSA